MCLPMTTIDRKSDFVGYFKRRTLTMALALITFILYLCSCEVRSEHLFDLTVSWMYLMAILIEASSALRVPVIIDTAIGSDFDDTMAISYALSRNDVFDIQLILTTTLNTTGRAQLLAKFLETTNRTDVDIGIGFR